MLSVRVLRGLHRSKQYKRHVLCKHWWLYWNLGESKLNLLLNLNSELKVFSETLYCLSLLKNSKNKSIRIDTFPLLGIDCPQCVRWQHSTLFALQWRHDEHDGVSNHRRLDCLLNRLSRLRSKETSKLRVTGLCEGNPPVTGGFPSQRSLNAENVSISWRWFKLLIFWFRYFAITNDKMPYQILKWSQTTNRYTYSFALYKPALSNTYMMTQR